MLEQCSQSAVQCVDSSEHIASRIVDNPEELAIDSLKVSVTNVNGYVNFLEKSTSIQQSFRIKILYTDLESGSIYMIYV